MARTSRRLLLAGIAPAAALPAAAAPAQGDALLLALHEELRGCEAEEDAACTAYNLVEGTDAAPAAEEARKLVVCRWSDLVERMAETPAEGMAGLAVKALRLVAAVATGSTAADDALAASVTRDAIRLGLRPTKGGAP